MYIGHEFQNKFPLSPLKPLKKVCSKLIPLIMVLIPAQYFFNHVERDALKDGDLLEIINTSEKIFFVRLVLTILVIVVPAIAYLYEFWYYKTYRYDLTEDYVIIKKGPIAPQEITIPYDRIQDVYLDQDVFDRIFGLYDVHISTATITSGMRAHIDGVDKKTPDALRERILKKMKK